MPIKFQPPSEEELAARGVTSSVPVADELTPAAAADVAVKTPRKRKGS